MCYLWGNLFFLNGPSWPWSDGSWIYNYLCIQCLSPLMLWLRIAIRARCTALCDKVCQWLSPGRWFSPDPPVSSINKTDRHDITEILLKHHQTNNIFSHIFCCFVYCVIYQDWFCFRYLTLCQIRIFLFFYAMATQVCIGFLYFIATHNDLYSV